MACIVANISYTNKLMILSICHVIYIPLMLNIISVPQGSALGSGLEIDTGREKDKLIFDNFKEIRDESIFHKRYGITPLIILIVPALESGVGNRY